MASQDAAARDRSQERSHIAYARAAEPDAGIPAHVALAKQLHSGTGYNLVIDTEGKVYGTREPYNKEGNHKLLNDIDFEFSMKMTQGHGRENKLEVSSDHLFRYPVGEVCVGRVHKFK